MSEGSYSYRHGFKDDYVYPSISAIKDIAKDLKRGQKWPDWMINNILRMIVHEGLYAEYQDELATGEVPGKNDKLF